jgi:cytochrome c biogenesis protein CcmG/thiol:disulfide interchange protein DsbE
MRLAPLAIFISLSLLLVALLLRQQMPFEAGGTSNSAFPVISIKTLDGKTAWKQEDLIGHVTVLNFFASWCTPCAAEMPELVALKKQFPHVRLEGVAWNDAPKTLNAWLKKNGNPFGNVWLDKSGDATMALGIRGIPETFVIDAKGIVRYRLSGPLTADMRTKEFGELLTTLLAEAADAQ